MSRQSQLPHSRIVQQSAGTIGKFDVVGSNDHLEGCDSVASGETNDFGQMRPQHCSTQTLGRESDQEVESNRIPGNVDQDGISMGQIRCNNITANDDPQRDLPSQTHIGSNPASFDVQTSEQTHRQAPVFVGAVSIDPASAEYDQYEQKLQEKERQKMEYETNTKVYDPEENHLASDEERDLNASGGPTPMEVFGSTISNPETEERDEQLEELDRRTRKHSTRAMYIILSVLLIVAIGLSLGIALGLSGSSTNEEVTSSMASSRNENPSALDSASDTTGDAESVDSTGQVLEAEGNEIEHTNLGDEVNGNADVPNVSSTAVPNYPVITTASTVSTQETVSIDPSDQFENEVNDNVNSAGYPGNEFGDVSGDEVDSSSPKEDTEPSCYNMSLEIITDTYASETSIQIINVTAKQSYRPSNEFTLFSKMVFENNELFQYDSCLPAATYTFSIEDYRGDGIYHQNNEGFNLKLTSNEMEELLVIRKVHDFGVHDATTFPIPFNPNELYLLEVEVTPSIGWFSDYPFWRVYQKDKVEFSNFVDLTDDYSYHDSKYLTTGDYKFVLHNIDGGDFNLLTINQFSGEYPRNTINIFEKWKDAYLYSLVFSIPFQEKQHRLLEIYFKSPVWGEEISWELWHDYQVILGNHETYNKNLADYVEAIYVLPGEYDLVISTGGAYSNNFGYFEVYLDVTLVDKFWTNRNSQRTLRLVVR